MAPGPTGPTLQPGESIGRYQVVELLGAGGMGEVYRARDPKLGRDVAVKIVASPATADPKWARLFEQEARGAAALNHPNVVAIYDATADAARACIVFELLDGESLRERLRQRDVTPPKAVAYAIQIAEGLAAIHAKGMVHRDLKPENVFVTRTDVVKILDFGIAKILETGRRDDVAEADTEGTTADPGRLRGTVGYMSPEQLRGEPLDSRSDIFSFGLILYELLARRPAFEGSTASVIAGILTQDPPPLPRTVPAGVRRVVQRCLEKRPEQRFHSAHDLSLALRSIAADLDAPRRGGRAALVGAGLLLAAIAATLAGVARRTAPTTPRPRVTGIEAETVPLTSTPGLEFQPALSRDGTSVAFMWDGEDGGNNFDIYTKSVDRQTTFRLTNDPATDCCPTWSPDARTIAFLRLHTNDAELLMTPSMGGTEHQVGLVHPWFGSGLTWSPDGAKLAFSNREGEADPFRISVLGLADGASRALTHPARGLAGDGLPAFSPDGTRLAFVRLPGLGDAFQWSELYVVGLDTGAEERVLRDPNLIGGLDWTSEGDELVFSASVPGGAARLWRVALADRSRRLVGDGVPLSNTTGAEALSSVSRALRVSVAAAAHRLAFARGSYDTDIWSVAPSEADRAPARLIASTRLDEAPQFSADGSHIAFASDRASAVSQIWVCNAQGAQCEQATSFASGCGTPRWSPDGRVLAFDAAPEGQTDIYVVEVASRAVRRLTAGPGHEAVPSWSRDGRHVYFASDRTGDWQIWKISVDGTHDEQVTRNGGYVAFEGEDGALYYTKGVAPGLFVRTADGRERVLTDVPQCKGYWALSRGGAYVVDSTAPGGPVLGFYDFAARRLDRLRPLPGEVACGETGLAASPDGRTLAYVSAHRGSDLVLVDKFH
jgi:eukaryotic-like serine/threonine-protein kinase